MTSSGQYCRLPPSTLYRLHLNWSTPSEIYVKLCPSMVIFTEMHLLNSSNYSKIVTTALPNNISRLPHPRLQIADLGPQSPEPQASDPMGTPAPESRPRSPDPRIPNPRAQPPDSIPDFRLHTRGSRFQIPGADFRRQTQHSRARARV